MAIMVPKFSLTALPPYLAFIGFWKIICHYWKKESTEIKHGIKYDDEKMLKS